MGWSGSAEWGAMAVVGPRPVSRQRVSLLFLWLTPSPLRPPPHATQLIVLLAMILLDGLDKHDDQPSSKLVAEASPSVIPVARVHTPTPSLPDYEASQAQLRPTTQSYSEIKKKRTRRRRCRKYTIIVLAAYFVLTVVIGIPIIVVVRLCSSFDPCSCASETIRPFL